jgi:hypothetical protein
MYLSVRKYVPRIDYAEVQTGVEPANTQEFDTLVSQLGVSDLIENDSWTGMTVEVPVAYWRKVNAVHAWFVNNCADGVDKCQSIYVSPDRAQELLELCNQVISNPEKAMKLLPPQSGFFFGGTEVDEWYMEGITYTASVLTKLLSTDNVDSVIYRASW